MMFLKSWQKDLSPKESLILIILLVFLFIFYEYILFPRLLTERYLSKAPYYLEKSRSLNGDLIVEKALLYNKALKLLKKATRLNSFDSRPYFEYAQAIAEVGDDPQLRYALDIKTPDGKLKTGENGFYNLAKSNYTEAILREPTNAIYHQRLGRAYDKLSDAKSAEEEFKKAALLSPESLSIHLYLSQYFFSKDNQADFLFHIKKAIELQRIVCGGVVAGEVSVFLKSIGREDLIKE